MNSSKTVVHEVANAVPSTAALFVTWVLGLSVEKWLALVSIGFIGLQAAYLVWKWAKEARRGGNK